MYRLHYSVMAVVLCWSRGVISPTPF